MYIKVWPKTPLIGVYSTVNDTPCFDFDIIRWMWGVSCSNPFCLVIVPLRMYNIIITKKDCLA